MKNLMHAVGAVICAVAGVLIVTSILGLSRVGSCGGVGDPVCPAGLSRDVFTLVGSIVFLAVGGVMTFGVGFFLAVLTGAVALIFDGHGTGPVVIGVVILAVPAAVLLLAMTVGAFEQKTKAVQDDFTTRAITVPELVLPDFASEPEDAAPLAASAEPEDCVPDACASAS